MKFTLRHRPPPREMVGDRDMTPATGRAGGPASWRRAVPDGAVALHQRDWADARWSSIYRLASGYARAEPADPARIEHANHAGRHLRDSEIVQGPMMKPAVWTWEIPLYFWFGGMAAGASFVALACDLVGDRRSVA